MNKTDMGVTLNELADGAVSEDYSVEVYIGSVKTWQVKVITPSGREVDVETKRGTVKTWTVFENALRDVQLYARGVKSISVKCRGMTFVLQK
ncbi:hypothetical protein [Burkholderia gladioli]|jgi:hypothetical protein|uniref:hypothetical protein n=1 Tax=Burkholderia gladioli TaxID=28095 RepID=UPI00163EE26F|nr:hypothetical protein [Burkholderia gladioli]MDN7465828.1 hypothetical protein [Burkholderia gladioli]